jgi:hypothetical protein
LTTLDQRWPLPRLWALVLLLLLVLTHRLWFTGLGSGEMPLVPLSSGRLDVPPGAGLIPTLALVLGLIAVVLSPVRCRRCWWLVAGSLLACFLIDQHRLQPWAYQSAIYAPAFAVMDQRQWRRWLIPLAASVYLYSAAGKLDLQFAHTVGQDFLAAVVRPLGGVPESWSLSSRARLAMWFPACELLCGAGLLLPVTRRVAAAGVIAMHAVLLALLGPWGRDHSGGVLGWNALLMVQAHQLFFRRGTPDWPAKGSQLAGGGVRLAQGLIVASLLCPLLERRGYWDHWPSWSLYSPHTSRVEIEVHRLASSSLDPHLASFLEVDEDGDGWRKLSIGRWSLASRGVPIYPQARYQLALAARIAAQSQLSDEIRARLQGVSDRWTGRRDEQLLSGRAAIDVGLQQYWLTR